MTRDGETVPQYLARMRERDLEKGGVGYRTTREIADYFGVSVGKMRRHLDRLYEEGCRLGPSTRMPKVGFRFHLGLRAGVLSEANRRETMTTQQSNSYSHLPEHPTPIFTPGSDWLPLDTFDKGPRVSNIALAIVAFFVVGAMLYASFYAGRMTTKRADDAKIEQAWRTGYVLGGLCRQDPAMAACSPESLRSGGVL